MKNFALSIVFLGLATLAGCGAQESRESSNRSEQVLQEVGEEANQRGLLGFSKSQANDLSQIQSSLPASVPTTPESLFLNASAAAYFCPSGSSYNASSKLCENAISAFGPFTEKMRADCKKWGGGNSCETDIWGKKFAASLRGTGVCAQGSNFDSKLGLCTEGNFAFGPFTKLQVESCRAAGGGSDCQTNRVASRFFIKKGIPAANQALLNYYSVRANYDKVYKEVLGFYAGGRSNGCVAFMTSALRQSGTYVPKDLNLGGYNVSLVTVAMAQYLQKNLGWKKITAAAQLLPGDVVLTQAEKKWPGVPAHTYMFHSWKDQAKGIGYVIDNQDFIHERNIFGYGTYNFTPFEYALRAP